MGSYSILEDGEGLASALTERFGPPCPPEEGPEVLIISPAAARRPLPRPLECGAVLLPGSASELLGGIRARSAVSYGLSPRDTITLSSREGSRFCAALQREIVCADGTVLERQELVLQAGPERDSMQVLLLLGACLLLGGGKE